MTAQDLPQRDLGEIWEHTEELEISRRRVRRRVARCRASRLQPDTCVLCSWRVSSCSRKALQRATRRQMATGLTVCQDIRSRPLCTCVLRPCLRLRLSSGKQEGAKESRQCGRVCDRTFIAASVAERDLRVAAGNRGRSAALHAPPDEGIAARRPEKQNSVTGVRDANGRALLDALQGVLQRKFSTVCRRSAL